MLTEPSAVWEVLHNKHDSLFADRVMKEADWERLRKSTYRHRLQPIKLAKVMFGYFWILLYVAALSVAVGLYYKTLVRLYDWPMLSLQSVQTFFSAVTFALTLLLVFKTNSSYARWWEARKDVGQLVSLAHNITRQAVAYFPAQQSQLTCAMGRWVSAVMWVVKSMVRPAAPRQLRDELHHVLLPQELDWLLAQPHKPLAVAQALSNIVAAADIDPMAKTRMDQMITLYTFEFGACGRIYNTAIPFCYTRHTSRFLMCYLTVLPLLLWPMSGWASPVLAVIIAFLLLGVENIGAFIEEPFHVIAFDTFCSAVHRDIQNIMSMHSSTAGNVPVVGGLNSASHEGTCQHSHTATTPTAAAHTAQHGLYQSSSTAAAATSPVTAAAAASAGGHAAATVLSQPGRPPNGLTAGSACRSASMDHSELKNGNGSAAEMMNLGRLSSSPSRVSNATSPSVTTAAAAGMAGRESTGARLAVPPNNAPAGPAAVTDSVNSSSVTSSSSAACLLSVHEQQQQRRVWNQR